MHLTLVTPPATAPVTVDEVKVHLRVEHNDEDGYFAGLIQTALERIDGRHGWLRRALVTQTWDYCLPYFPMGERICLPLPPLQSVVSIKYFDQDNAEQTLSAGAYQAVSATDEGYVRTKDGTPWPIATYERPDAVTLRMVVGYGDAAAVPASIKHAMLVDIGHLYANRGDAPADNTARVTSRRLLAPHKRVLLR